MDKSGNNIYSIRYSNRINREENMVNSFVFLVFLFIVFAISLFIFINICRTLNKFISLLLSSKGISASKFDCASPIALPECSTTTITTIVGTDILSTGGFLTTNIVLPTSKKLPPISSQYPLPYYHSHPSALYDGNNESVLYSFPFLINTNYPDSAPPYFTINTYSYSNTPNITYTNGFEQFSFQVNADAMDSTNSWVVRFDSATETFDLATSIDNVVSIPPFNPSLSTILQSGNNFILVFTQGVPYITLSPFNTTSQQFTITGTNRETVTIPNYTCEILSYNNGYIVNIFLSTNNVTITSISTYTTGTPSSREYYYLFLFRTLPSTLSEKQALFTAISNNINLPLLFISDIGITTNDNKQVFIKYTCPTMTVGGSVNSLMWIIPPTIHSAKGLTEASGISSYLALPAGYEDRLYLSTPTTSVSSSFYSVWSLVDFPSDFNYSFLNSNRIIDTAEHPLNNLNDLYELTLSMRIMVKNGNGLSIPFSTSMNAITYWRNMMLKIQYDPDAMGLRIDNLGNELGLITYFSYLLLSYINLLSISESGLWPTTSEPYLTINDQYYKNLILAIIDTGFTTELPTPSIFFPLQFVDFYTCTITNVDYSEPDSSSAYYSRFGEALGYLWGSYYIRRRTSVSGPPIDLLTAIYSIVTASTPRLLRGECNFPSKVSFPVLPWNGLYSTSEFGFQLDPSGKDNLGESPDAIFIQSLLPFCPTTHHIIYPILRQYIIHCMKILKCNQQIGITHYYFGGWVDPRWVGYFLYLFDPLDRANTIITGSLDSNLLVFIQSVHINYLLPALLMNQEKQLSI